MTELATREGQAAADKGVLYLQFRIGGQRFAVDVREVIEVLPRRTLKPIAKAPQWVAGVFSHRGVLVPVIDMAALSFGQPAAARSSTRLVLVHYHGEPQRPGQQLGLILEQATDTVRCRPEEFQPYHLDNGEAPYLGPVREDEHGLLQRIRVNDLLPEAVRQLLYADPSGQEPA